MSKKTLHKDVHSKYSTSLSSYQIWKILNQLLYTTLTPVTAYSNSFLNSLLLSCLDISTGFKRIISSKEPKDLMTICFTMLITSENTSESKLNNLSTIMDFGLERNILHEYANYAISSVRDFPPNIDVNNVIAHTDYHLKLYEKFRNDVANRFKNLTDYSAKKNHYSKKLFGLDAEENEHVNVFAISLYRAIDKFIPTSGTLTSYILQWFKNAQGASSYMIYSDEVFDLSRSIRRKIHEENLNIRNKVVPISDRENEIPEEYVNTSMDLIHKLAKLPNSTLMFYSFGIPYSPSDIFDG